jgi:hypothetical protein
MSIGHVCLPVCVPDVHHQETMDDTAAVERLAEQLGVGIGGQQEDPMEPQQQRKEHHELKRLKDNIDRPVSQGSTFNVLQVGFCSLLFGLHKSSFWLQPCTKVRCPASAVWGSVHVRLAAYALCCLFSKAGTLL